MRERIIKAARERQRTVSRDRTLRHAGLHGPLARGWLAGLFALGLAACGDAAPDRPIVYRGEYHYDPASAYLVQVGVQARICLSGADMTPAVQPEFVQTGGISDVVVRGLLSAAGRHGPQGVCTYELTEAELLGVGERRQRE